MALPLIVFLFIVMVVGLGGGILTYTWTQRRKKNHTTPSSPVPSSPVPSSSVPSSTPLSNEFMHIANVENMRCMEWDPNYVFLSMCAPTSITERIADAGQFKGQYVSSQLWKLEEGKLKTKKGWCLNRGHVPFMTTAPCADAVSWTHDSDDRLRDSSKGQCLTMYNSTLQILDCDSAKPNNQRWKNIPNP